MVINGRHINREYITENYIKVIKGISGADLMKCNIKSLRKVQGIVLNPVNGQPDNF